MKHPKACPRIFLSLLFLLGGSVLPEALAGEPPALLLWNSAQVDSEGIFLSQITARDPTITLPHLRLADAPAFGQSLVLTRTDIARLLQKAAPESTFTNWAGADRIRITRLSRSLNEDDLKLQLTAVLQREQLKDKGELELHFTRPWATIPIPDEPSTVKIVDLPASGISPGFVLRFQLNTSKEAIGTWQMPVTARLWREIWVARSALTSHQLLSEG